MLPLVIVAVLALAGVLAEHRWIQSLRAGQQALRVAAQEQISLKDASELETLRNEKRRLSSLDVQQLRIENRKLPKLRGEIAQLREKRKQFERLRQDIARLARAQPSTNVPAVSQQSVIFVRSDEYLSAAFEDPVQALRSIISAARHDNAAGMLRCLPPDVASEWKGQLENLKQRFALHFEDFAEAHSVIATNTISPDEVVLRVRAPSGLERAIPLKRIHSQWKLKNVTGF